MKKYLIAAPIFLVSAFASVVFVGYGPNTFYRASHFFTNFIEAIGGIFWVNPSTGILFGIALLLTLRLLKKEIGYLSSILIVISSAIGYMAANFIAEFYVDDFGITTGWLNSSIASIAIASGIGFLITVMPFMFRKKIKANIWDIMTGMLIAAVIGGINNLFPWEGQGWGGDSLPFTVPYLFISWQVIMGLYIIYMLPKDSSLIESEV